MKRAYALCIAVLALIALSAIMPPHAARATIQEEDCIDPAVEYPIPCDDDGD